MSLRWRIITVALVVVSLAYLALANAVPSETRRESWLLPDAGLRLGLDLRGGIHWVLGVQLEAAIAQELEYLRGVIESELEDASVTATRLAVEEERIVIESEPGDQAAIREVLGEFDTLSLASSSDGALRYAIEDGWTQEVRERAMLQVLEVLRNRIDDPQTGIPESVITRQGDDRILVQIPGGDAEREQAQSLLEQTGFLEFKIVQAADESEELLRARYPEGLPEGNGVVVQRDRLSGRVTAAYLVPDQPAITGKYLNDARVSTDARQRPIVSFTWSTEGAKIFSELTEENIDRNLAIILDEEAYSAPVIRSRIGTRGQIDGRFTWEEASQLAVVLRAGSLSVPVVIEEERTVGPALGADSIQSGVRASIVGLLIVVAFAVGYYRLSGGYASVALLVNLIMVIGLMSGAGATLTLPGIAGLVLTVGMAIDANVIIFERIREELRAGKLPRAAVATGFNKALSTVLDANVTTLITAVILLEFGTGPIKGFGLTLAVGILTSVFAAMVITRLLFQIYPGHRTVEALSI